ncbi:TetR/AcrR family transcriptional regulator [Enterococcus sp. DIV0800]|uniref:TetR/AcrR family transcriptional regulator n=1 Tax=unclassified Enterococcus TaxID=2608891 RepID=UPI003D2FB840
MQRKRILLCALDHLNRYPLEDLNITMISQELKISRSTIYYYFSNIDEILSGCVSLFLDGLQDTFDKQSAYATLPKKRPSLSEFLKDRESSTSEILLYLKSERDCLYSLLKHNHILDIQNKIYGSYTRAFQKAVPREFAYLFPKDTLHTAIIYIVGGNIQLAHDWLYGSSQDKTIEEITEIINRNMFFSLFGLYEISNVKDID